MRLSMKNRRILEGYSFVSIWIIGFFLFMAVPLGRSFFYSLNHLRPSTEGLQATFAGLTNYRQAFTTDIHFLPLLLETMTTMVTQVPLILIFAMFSAILLNRKMVGRTFFSRDLLFTGHNRIRRRSSEAAGAGSRDFAYFLSI